MKHANDAVLQVLRRVLANGPLDHLPGRDSDLELILALAASRFEAGTGYTEARVNDTLAGWLETFSSPSGVDHVTVRRCLVDGGFLVRDKAGASYRVSVARLEGALERDAWSVDPARVLEEVRRERAERKQRRA